MRPEKNRISKIDSVLQTKNWCVHTNDAPFLALHVCALCVGCAAYIYALFMVPVCAAVCVVQVNGAMFQAVPACGVHVRAACAAAAVCTTINSVCCSYQWCLVPDCMYALYVCDARVACTLYELHMLHVMHVLHAPSGMHFMGRTLMV